MPVLSVHTRIVTSGPVTEPICHLVRQAVLCRGDVMRYLIMSEYDCLEYEVDGAAAVLTMDSPENRNALSGQMVADLSAALRAAERDDDVRAVILTGTEGAFCAGANIDDFKFDGSEAVSGRILSDEDFREPFDLIEHLDKPVIAAVNGTAMGGGFELALVSDLVVVGEDVTIGVPEVNIGAAPGVAFIRLPEIIDHHKAMELMLTGKHITGAEAVEMGLFNDAVPVDEVHTRADEYVSQIAETAPVALTVIKKIANRHRGAEDNLVADLGLGILFETDDIREGTRAFAEKRDPEFEGH